LRTIVGRNTAGEGLEEFKGIVVDVTLEKNSKFDTDQDQYHITMRPEGVTMKGKTGVFHEWVKFSKKATQKSVPEGSIMERYLSQIETLIPEAKKAETLDQAFALLKGKKFLFRKVKLGRAFQGNQPKEMWTPVAMA
jgi:hypothetical protein